ncbi:dienelactone hydrolase family protein [Gaetbulibacter aestuarii]|uniref:Dienelactone hydrolase family protein n=1 Tax=Gaetbulibacter aestuarii TaxID=1502358 RepID=A0ABW7MXS6_9FLAO
MNQLKTIGIIAAMVISLVGCNKSDVNFEGEFDNTGGNTNPDLPRTEQDVRNDFQNLNLQPGINDVQLESLTEGLFWKFRVIVPEGASDTNKKPLIFNLHGSARTVSADIHKSTGCLIEPATDGILDAYIISPNSDGKLWYEVNNQIQILALYDLATSYLYVDTTKTAITGYSDGGNGSWFYMQYFPDMFSAAIPMATSYNTVKNDGSIEAIQKPLYVIHGENDQLFPLATTQGYVDASINAGSDITFVVAPGLDHYQPCDYVSYLRDGIEWLTNTVWN